MICPWCGDREGHAGICPRVSAMDFYEQPAEDGNQRLRRIEFHKPIPGQPDGYRPEDDESYRKRLMRVIPDSSVNYEALLGACQNDLDTLGSYHDTPRGKVPIQ